MKRLALLLLCLAAHGSRIHRIQPTRTVQFLPASKTSEVEPVAQSVGTDDDLVQQQMRMLEQQQMVFESIAQSSAASSMDPTVLAAIVIAALGALLFLIFKFREQLKPIVKGMEDSIALVLYSVRRVVQCGIDLVVDLVLFPLKTGITALLRAWDEYFYSWKIIT